MPAVIRILLAAAGAITGLLVADSEPNFAVVQGMVAIGLIALLVGVLAFLSRRG